MFKQSYKEQHAYLDLRFSDNRILEVLIYLYSACEPLRKMDHAHYLHVMHQVDNYNWLPGSKSGQKALRKA
ncbi:hypothetical protein ACFL6U_15580 [Planctomycetota bacterium]